MCKYLTCLVLFTIASYALGDGGFYEDWTPEQLATLKDPSKRNEDISNTAVNVKIKILGDGNYLYEYSVNSAATNLGTIMNMVIDVSCEQPSTTPLGYPEPTSFSDDKKHIILGSQHSDFPDSFAADITAANEAIWSLLLKPSEFQAGLILISAEPPVFRRYELNVLMDTYGWAYQLYAEDDPSLPWIDDFRVAGSILGPRCSTDISPIPPYENSDNNAPDNGDAKCPKGNAYGLDIGKGHETSKGKHNGHSHYCP